MLGYSFGHDGVLRDNNGEKFSWKGQDHYNALGNLVSDFIQQKMKLEYGLEEIPTWKVFSSPNLHSFHTVLWIIQGMQTLSF